MSGKQQECSQASQRQDAKRIAQLMQHGLLKPSFVPGTVLRDLRELSRDRTSLVAERSRLKNRIQKILEDANIKLGSVASDILGKNGRAMLTAMVKGKENPKQLADLAQGQLRLKIPQLVEALRGQVRAVHRFRLQQQLERIGSLCPKGTKKLSYNRHAAGRCESQCGKMTF